MGNNGILASGSPGGAKVLVVEDDALIALDLAMTLQEVGCVPLGPASSVAEALPHWRTKRLTLSCSTSHSTMVGLLRSPRR